MDTITIGAISAIWRLFTWLPAFYLRRVFTKARLSELILFDLRPRFDPATINLGESASYEIWLQLTNLSPFLVEFDQASFKFFCGGVTLKSSILEHMKFESGQTQAFSIDGSIDHGQANQIARTLDNLNARLEGVMEFKSDLHSFSKKRWSLSGINPRILNAGYRHKLLT